MQYSADDSTWTDVSNPSPSTLGGTPGAAGTLSMTCDAPSSAYRYWRLYKTNSPTSGSWQEWNKLYEFADDSPKVDSSMIKFDGTGDELEITTNSSDFNFETGNFTTEFWVRFNDITTDNQQFLFKRNSTYYGDYVLWWSIKVRLSIYVKESS